MTTPSLQTLRVAFQYNTDCDGWMDGRRHIYNAIHAISLLNMMINSDISYVNLCFGMGAINSTAQNN